MGGGSTPRPGEISLAHHGVLFLDELPEFDRDVLEVLREPMESGHITISRAARQCDFPARFQLVAAMNPCPCGYLGDRRGRCRCTPGEVARYRNRLSGPFIDRIDLHVEVLPLTPDELQCAPPGEASAAVRERVVAARQRQLARQSCANALLHGDALDEHCKLAPEAAALAKHAAARLHLSARAYHRLLRVSRSIADLAGAGEIAAAHVAEAVQYRRP